MGKFLRFERAMVPGDVESQSAAGPVYVDPVHVSIVLPAGKSSARIICGAFGSIIVQGTSEEVADAIEAASGPEPLPPP
jgi:hypothetical protein